MPKDSSEAVFGTRPKREEGQEASESGTDRREALKKIGKTAAYVTPAILVFKTAKAAPLGSPMSGD